MLRIEQFWFGNAKMLEVARGIRTEVFIVGQNVPKELEYEFDEEAHHYLLYLNNEAIGTARWRLTQLGIKLERFAILATHRNKGYGTELLKKILGDIILLERPIYLHSQVAALNYYKNGGFKIEGNEFKEAGISHYKMVYTPYPL